MADFTLSKGFLIYALLDPQTRRVRYVGKSSSGTKRPKQHWRVRKERLKDDRCHRWVRSVLRTGKCPVIDVLEVLEPGPDIQVRLAAAEARWIWLFRTLGEDLTNTAVTESPERLPARSGWHHSLRTRRMMSKKLSGRLVPAYHRRALRRAVRKDHVPVCCLNDGTYHRSMSDAARAYGVRVQHVWRICRKQGRQKTINGLSFALV